MLIMVQIIKCKLCDNSNIKFGTVSVNVELSKGFYCDTCNKSDIRKQSYFFCSDICFLTYMRQVLDLKKELSWIE